MSYVLSWIASLLSNKDQNQHTLKARSGSPQIKGAGPAEPWSNQAEDTCLSDPNIDLVTG